MNVLVIGGAGYIGSHVAKALHEAGHTPIIYDSMEHGHDWAIKWGPLIEGNLFDRPRLINALEGYKIDAVMHFASYINVRESTENPGKYYQNNLLGTHYLIEAMLEVGIKHLVFSSTAAVYGLPQETPISESHPKNPINPYGRTKHLVEEMLQDYPLHTAILRYFNAAGADASGTLGEAHSPETHLIPNAIRAAIDPSHPLTIYGDGHAIRDYIHVTDLAAAHLLALTHITQKDTSLLANVGTGTGHTVLDIIDTITTLFGPVPHTFAPPKPADPHTLIADATHLRSLGWTPQHSTLPNIIDTALCWHQATSSLNLQLS